MTNPDKPKITAGFILDKAINWALPNWRAVLIISAVVYIIYCLYTLIDIFIIFTARFITYTDLVLDYMQKHHTSVI